MKLRLLFVCATGAVLAAVFAAPLVPALYLAFAAVCHQEPGRCFELYGIALPVCARCLGIYAGAFAAALVPLRLPTPLLWALAAINALQFLSQAGGAETRLLLAFALCWPALSSLRTLASARDAAGN